MSDNSVGSTTIGEVVDATTSDVASDAAAQAAGMVSGMIPEPDPTTVVVETGDNGTTADALSEAQIVRAEMRSEIDAYMTELIAYENAKQAAATPQVVVVESQAPAPAPAPSTEAPTDAAPDPTPDEAPPMAKSHPYYRPLFKGKKK